MGHICNKLHQLFHTLPEYSFPFDEERIPLNGIYLFFENGETGHNTDRIVQIGSHSGKDQLRSRLTEHFTKENKDRSIFRKNIGRAILSRERDPFLVAWEVDLTSHDASKNYQNLIDFRKKDKVEKLVTQTIQSSFRFIVFRVEDKNERMMWKDRIISTVSLCSECQPSKGWLGNYSPVEKIRESGLWNVQGLYKDVMSGREYETLEKLITLC